MPRRLVANNAKTKVDEHKTGGGPGLGGFETLEDQQGFVTDYARSAATQCISDCSTAYSGSPRVQSFTGSSMTAQEKTDTGVDQIASWLFDIYIQNNSTIVHEGGVGNTVFIDGTVYWFPCTGANTDDFEKFQNLLERRMAYEYINQASGSTANEKSNALNDYTNYRDNTL